TPRCSASSARDADIPRHRYPASPPVDVPRRAGRCACGAFGDAFVRQHELPKLLLADDFDDVTLVGKPADLHELEPTVIAGNLKRVRAPAHEHVRRAAGL